MNNNLNLDFKKHIGHSTLLYGEANTKKTFYTSKFVQFLLESQGITPKDISILDFAPNLTTVRNLKIGGKIQDFYENSTKCRNILFKGEIIPPRLNSRNKTELYQNAYKNYKKTYNMLKEFKENPTPILIINDISIYLHMGSLNLLLKAINNSSTFYGNSYYGSSIKKDFATLFSRREKRQVENLIKEVEKSYFTS
ncbi:MAG: hypothetical protein ACXAAH_04230 [Promethearchaeota archaeon]|jgi:hypothetical protein